MKNNIFYRLFLFFLLLPLGVTLLQGQNISTVDAQRWEAVYRLQDQGRNYEAFKHAKRLPAAPQGWPSGNELGTPKTIFEIKDALAQGHVRLLKEDFDKLKLPDRPERLHYWLLLARGEVYAEMEMWQYLAPLLEMAAPAQGDSEFLPWYLSQQVRLNIGLMQLDSARQQLDRLDKLLANNKSYVRPSFVPLSRKKRYKNAATEAHFAHELTKIKLLTAKGQYEAAQNAVFTAGTQARKALGSNSRSVALFTWQLGRIKLAMQDFGGAYFYYERTAKLLAKRKVMGKGHPLYPRFLVEHSMREYEQGEVLSGYREALNLDKIKDGLLATSELNQAYNDLLEDYQFYYLGERRPGLARYGYTGATQMGLPPWLLHKLQLQRFYSLVENNRLEGARTHLRMMDSTMVQLVGKDAPLNQMWVLQSSFMGAQVLGQFAKYLAPAQQSWHGSIKHQIVPEHQQYALFASMLGALYMENDQFDSARTYLAAAHLIVKDYYGENSTNFARAGVRWARLLQREGKYRDAEYVLQEGYDIARRNEGTESLPFLNVSSALGRLYVDLGLFSVAEQMLVSVGDKATASFRQMEDYNPDGLENVVQMHINSGQFVRAREQLTEIIDNRSRLNAQHYSLYQPYLLLSTLELAVGDYSQAEDAAVKAIQIAEANYGAASSPLAHAQLQLANVYVAIGAYTKAETLYRKSIAIFTRVMGEGSLPQGMAQQKLALCLVNKGQDLEVADSLIQRTIASIDVNLGRNHHAYATALKDRALIKVRQGDSKSSLQLLNDAMDVAKESMGRKSYLEPELYFIAGDVYTTQGDLRAAKRAYKESAQLYSRFVDNKHPRYVATQGRLARVEYLNGERKRSIRDIQLVLDADLEYIQSFFPYLSDRERTYYWALLRPDFEFFNTVAQTYYGRNPDLAEQMLDNSMATKAILLNSVKVTQNFVANTEDTTLQKMFKEFRSINEVLIPLQGNPNADPNTIATLKNKAENLEKSINARSPLMATLSATNRAGWQQVQAKLKPNEYLVDVTRSRLFGSAGFTDSVVYLFTIMGHEGFPSLVVNENGNRLENLSLRYYRNAIRYQVEDEKSYADFWGVLAPHLPVGSTVYFCADGVYSQINLETLRKPGSSTWLMDEYTFVPVGNPKALLDPPRPAVNGGSALVLGNPLFYKKKPAYTELAALPGTQAEVTQVANLLTDKGFTVKKWTEAKASEDSLKAVVTSPTVLHVASHGYFVEQASSLYSIDELLDRSLMNSGLALQGAGDLLANKEAARVGASGILTAAEVMFLPLQNTSLVVLSACETGLGTVSVGEGVYGLQRAFAVAGAQSVVMSLFKVEDQATQKLMTLFYRNWLATGKKRESLTWAKKELRKEYPDPLFWGSFVMIGN